MTVNSLHPGSVATELARYFPGYSVLYPCLGLFLKSPWEGAQTNIHCAVEESLENVSGKYFRCSETVFLLNGNEICYTIVSFVIIFQLWYIDLVLRIRFYDSFIYMYSNHKMRFNITLVQQYCLYT